LGDAPELVAMLEVDAGHELALAEQVLDHH
jgi:hypothetical protein